VNEDEAVRVLSTLAVLETLEILDAVGAIVLLTLLLKEPLTVRVWVELLDTRLVFVSDGFILYDGVSEADADILCEAELLELDSAEIDAEPLCKEL
jgi:hypothetical protein